MPRIRDILIHVAVETAKRKRKCYRDQDHSIRAGERCLVIKTGPMNAKNNYCLGCAAEILSKATNRLGEIKGHLQVGAPQ